MQPLRHYPSVVACIAAVVSFSLARAQSSPPATPPATAPVATLTPGSGSVYPTPAVPGATSATPALTPGAGVTVGPIRTVINDAAWNQSAVTSRPSSRHSARLINLSARGRVGSDSSTLIAGAGVAGTGDLPVLARGIGPGLRTFGLSNAIVYGPTLTIFKQSDVGALTNTTGTVASTLASQVGAFPATPSDATYATGDASLAGQIAAGTVTAHCTAQTGDTGVAMLEFYDGGSAAADDAAHFVNFSARASIGAGSEILVAGFVVQGEGTITLLLRASGASLQQFGVTDTLADPVVDLYAGTTRIATNDDWQSSNAATIRLASDAVGAFAQTSPKDAALLVTLSAGSYTLHVHSAAAGTPAVALAEIYAVPARPSFDAAGAVNAVGLDLFRQLATNSGNLILSPYSIESAFALAYAGAAGDTRAEMSRILRLPDDNLTMVAGLDTLRIALETMAAESAKVAIPLGADAIQWQVANRLFGEQNYPFRNSYTSLLRDGFNAPLQEVNFSGAVEAARVTINDWVAAQTRNRILDLIPEGNLEASTRAVLVNALYLKAPWSDAFAAYRTNRQTFHLAGGGSMDVAMMNKDATVGYAVETGCTVATLDYIGSQLQFVAILPAEGETVDTVAARLTVNNFARWANLRTTSAAYVALSVPKFKVAGATIPLAEALIALGMKTAFDIPSGSANFDGIAPRTPDENLALKRVYHKTFVAIDEVGTEAAAATAIVVEPTVALPPPTISFRLDRPFLFAIQHRDSGALLFIGRIDTPTT